MYAFLFIWIYPSCPEYLDLFYCAKMLYKCNCDIYLYFCSDIKSVRDNKMHFDKISSELDNVLIRNSQTPRSKHQEVEEVQNILIATRSCFGHQALDYVNSICVLQSKKRHEILSTVSKNSDFLMVLSHISVLINVTVLVIYTFISNY